MSSSARVLAEPDRSVGTPVGGWELAGSPRARCSQRRPLALLTVDELDELTRVTAGRAVPADAAGIDAVHALMRRAPPRLPLRAFEAELLDTVP